MISIIHHRGPDQGGLYTDEQISLGHRRLSIIDLSKAGNQPMSNEDGSVVLIFNGEIYNFKELRRELEQLHHRFSSDTDTEVLIHGYEQWGKDVIKKLNGMFAFCLYDLNKKKLLLARDRMGIKPLYYYFNQDQFIFASEIKPILLAEIPRQPDLAAAYSYLNLRYIPGEKTLFKGIKKLLPGHLLIYDLKTRELSSDQYWDVPLPNLSNHSLGTAANNVKELLFDSIKRRLVADVPVGVYLSGGIDSATITALASQIKGEQESIKTFSVGFNHSEEVDELDQARKIAAHFNTDHHEITVDEEISDILPKLIWHLDMPHGDPVIIPQFKLSQLASQKVKVVLSGEGADELFAGYVQYKNFILAQKTRLIPSAITSPLAQTVPVKVFDKFFSYPSSMGEKGKEKVLDFINNLNNKEQSYQDLTSITSQKDRSYLFTENFKKFSPKQISKFQSERKPLLNQLLYHDIKKWLPNYVLFINDRMTMANSIEGRVPFLDHRLVEYSTTLPAKYKLGSTTKLVLRKAAKDLIPNPQTKKHAFFMPLDHWYKEELKPLAEQFFTPKNVKKRGYFNHHSLKKIWDNYPSSKLLYGKQLFTLINFELWHRLFIDEETIPKDNTTKMWQLL